MATSKSRNTPHRVVIIGGGFGGLSAAKVLARQTAVQVTLIDRRNHHLFQPLLYQVATAGLNPGDIAVPIRGEFAQSPNVEIHLGEVTQIQLDQQTVISTSGNVPYDSLILACGSQHSYFGKSEWEEFAPGLKTLEQATEIRRRILTAFEDAENATDPARQSALLTFVIVGGGPTGVELAGAVAEVARKVLVKDFRRIDPRQTRVVLIEAGPRVLAMFDESLSRRTTRDLEALGVEVRTSTRVTAVDAQGVQVGSERIEAATVVWAAGVSPSSLNAKLGVALDSAGRILVHPDLSVPSHTNVFVIGDQAHFEVETGRSLPGLAPVALQQGRAAARNILRDVAGKPRLPFRYVDKGQMATIGKSRAVLELGVIKLGGFLAWLGWLVVHLFFLVGFKNRYAVLVQWIWNYVFSKRGARLITRPDWRIFKGNR